MKIDLTKMNPVFNGLTVLGKLNVHHGKIYSDSYSIGFKLVCTSTYCDSDEIAQEEPEDEVSSDTDDDSDPEEDYEDDKEE